MTQIKNIPRPEKLEIARKVHQNLIFRAANSPAEPALDEYIIEISEVITVLGDHVAGRDTASAAREVRLARADMADVEVDTWLRHIESYLQIEANRRAGPHVVECKALHAAACPDGLAHVDDRIVEENAHCRVMLSVLRSQEHAPVLAAIELPPAWIDRFEAAITESDAAIEAVIAARDDKTTHVSLGQNAESAWVDLMVRLRRYLNSRARRGDAVKAAENRNLLSPLLAAVKKLRADAAARATRRANAAAQSPAGADADAGAANGDAAPSSAQLQ